jgi:hypothetical protein
MRSPYREPSRPRPEFARHSVFFINTYANRVWLARQGKKRSVALKYAFQNSFFLIGHAAFPVMPRFPSPRVISVPQCPASELPNNLYSCRNALKSRPCNVIGSISYVNSGSPHYSRSFYADARILHHLPSLVIDVILLVTTFAANS